MTFQVMLNSGRFFEQQGLAGAAGLEGDASLLMGSYDRQLSQGGRRAGGSLRVL